MATANEAKTEAPKTEAPKTEAPKTEAPKTEAPQTEVVVATKAAEKAARARLREGYDRFVERLQEELKERGKVGRKQWEDAVASAREFVQKSKPELKREDVERFVSTLRKDVSEAVRSIKTRGDGFTRSEAFLTARDKGAELVMKIASMVKDAAQAIETNLGDVLKYKNGDMVGGGRFVCTKCGEVLTAETGPLPACAKCACEELRRKI